MDSCDSSITSSSDEEDIRLRPKPPLWSERSICKIIDILPGETSVSGGNVDTEERGARAKTLHASSEAFKDLLVSQNDLRNFTFSDRYKKADHGEELSIISEKLKHEVQRHSSHDQCDVSADSIYQDSAVLACVKRQKKDAACQTMITGDVIPLNIYLDGEDSAYVDDFTTLEEVGNYWDVLQNNKCFLM